VNEDPAFRHKYETQVLPFYRSAHFGAFSGVGGLKIRYAAFSQKKSSGALILLPGKSETYLKYAELFFDLRELPLSLYGMDHRGMGFSERMLPDRLKVHVERFDDYLEDVRTFVQEVVETDAQERLFVLGHSTGALIAALYLQRFPQTFQAGILCSPLFGLKMGPLPGFLLRLLARRIDRPGRHEQYAPGQRELKRPSFRSNTITHSYPRWSLWEQEIIPTTEAIRLGGVTNHWIRESLLAGRRAVLGAGKIAVPLLLLQAEQDAITAAAPQERFCALAPRCRRLRLMGARHEILIERDDIRSGAIARIKEFLTALLREGVEPL
jgi:lysophospholipase